MRIAVLLTIAMLSLAAGSLSAGSVVTQEVVNVRGYVKGSTTLKLSGTLSETAMEALSKGASVSIRNDLANYLCAPTQLDKNDKGYAKKAGTQKISAKLKKRKVFLDGKGCHQEFCFRGRR